MGFLATGNLRLRLGCSLLYSIGITIGVLYYNPDLRTKGEHPKTPPLKWSLQCLVIPSTSEAAKGEDGLLSGPEAPRFLPGLLLGVCGFRLRTFRVWV